MIVSVRPGLGIGLVIETGNGVRFSNKDLGLGFDIKFQNHDQFGIWFGNRHQVGISFSNRDRG